MQTAQNKLPWLASNICEWGEKKVQGKSLDTCCYGVQQKDKNIYLILSTATISNPRIIYKLALIFGKLHGLD